MSVIINSTNVDRLRKATEHSIELEISEKPEVIVTDHTSGSGEAHVVNMERLDCTCADFEHNCSDGEYCKHVWYSVLRRTGML